MPHFRIALNLDLRTEIEADTPKEALEKMEVKTQEANFDSLIEGFDCWDYTIIKDDVLKVKD